MWFDTWCLYLWCSMVSIGQIWGFRGPPEFLRPKKLHHMSFHIVETDQRLPVQTQRLWSRPDQPTCDQRRQSRWRTSAGDFRRLVQENMFNWLVVDLILWKMMEFVSWDDYSQYIYIYLYLYIYIWKNKSHVPNHQPLNWFPENEGQFTPNMCLENNNSHSFFNALLVKSLWNPMAWWIISSHGSPNHKWIHFRRRALVIQRGLHPLQTNQPYSYEEDIPYSVVPPSCKLVYKPSNFSYIPINPSEPSYKST